jgi:hypothetical protein
VITGSLCWLMLLLTMCNALLIIPWCCCRQRSRASIITAKAQRLLKPRMPDDCPACHQAVAPTSETVLRLSVQPWCEMKSRRGAPKRINIQGFACPNRRCAYYHIRDALVGDGTYGTHERIQTFAVKRAKPCDGYLPYPHMTTGMNGPRSQYRRAARRPPTGCIAVQCFGYTFRTIGLSESSRARPSAV